MQPLIGGLTMSALLTIGTWMQYRLANGRMWHPLRMAFTTSLGAALFLVAGGTGFRLDRHSALLAGTQWAGGVIWWEIWTGLILAALAAIFWRLAIRETDRLIRQAR